MPLKYRLDSIRSVFGGCRVDLAGVSQQEVKRCSGDSAFSSVRFELVGLAFATIGADRFSKVREIEVGGVAAETVALDKNLGTVPAFSAERRKPITVKSGH